MEILKLAEYPSVLLDSEQFQRFKERTITIEVEYLEPDECLYTAEISGTLVKECESCGRVTEYFVFVFEFLDNNKSSISRIYYFNSLLDAVTCLKKVTEKYVEFDTKNKADFVDQQTKIALSSLTSNPVNNET